MMTDWQGWLPDGGLLKDRAALAAGGAGGISVNFPYAGPGGN